MSLYNDVKTNDDIYEFVILYIVAFNDQDLEQMIHEANVFVKSTLCENVSFEDFFILASFCEDAFSVQFDIILAEFDIILAEFDIIFAEFDIILAESDIILAEFDIIFAEFVIITAETNIIIEKVFVSSSSANHNITKSFIITFEEISSSNEDSDSNFAKTSFVTSQKEKFEIEILNDFVLLTSTSLSTNTQMMKTA
jgi:hypothetical protein